MVRSPGGVSLFFMCGTIYGLTGASGRGAYTPWDQPSDGSKARMGSRAAIQYYATRSTVFEPFDKGNANPPNHV